MVTGQFNLEVHSSTQSSDVRFRQNLQKTGQQSLKSLEREGFAWMHTGDKNMQVRGNERNTRGKAKHTHRQFQENNDTLLKSTDAKEALKIHKQ